MRLIDADALNEHKLSITPLRYHVGWNNAIDAVIENAPTIDAVPVVRCGKCEYMEACKSIGEYKGKHGFCSYGERRNDENRN